MSAILETNVISCKDVETMLGCSERTAKKYYKEIKEEFHLQVVLKHHFNRYFKIVQ